MNLIIIIYCRDEENLQEEDEQPDMNLYNAPPMGPQNPLVTSPGFGNVPTSLALSTPGQYQNPRNVMSGPMPTTSGLNTPLGRNPFGTVGSRFVQYGSNRNVPSNVGSVQPSGGIGWNQPATTSQPIVYGNIHSGQGYGGSGVGSGGGNIGSDGGGDVRAALGTGIAGRGCGSGNIRSGSGGYGGGSLGLGSAGRGSVAGNRGSVPGNRRSEGAGNRRSEGAGDRRGDRGLGAASHARSSHQLNRPASQSEILREQAAIRRKIIQSSASSDVQLSGRNRLGAKLGSGRQILGKHSFHPKDP